MAIRTFPILFTDEQLDKIEKKAEELGIKSKKEFIYQAIKEKLEK
jgi:hypothetical protein